MLEREKQSNVCVLLSLSLTKQTLILKKKSLDLHHAFKCAKLCRINVQDCMLSGGGKNMDAFSDMASVQ